MQTVPTNFSRVRSRYQGRAIDSVYTLIHARDSSPRDVVFLHQIYVSLIAQLVCSGRAGGERERERAGGYALFITAVMSWVTCGGNCPRRSSTVFCRESRMPRSTPLSRSARTTSIFPQSAASCIAVPADVLVFTSTPAASNTSTTALKPTYLYFPFFSPLFFFSDWIMARRFFSFFFLSFFFCRWMRKLWNRFLDETGENI